MNQNKLIELLSLHNELKIIDTPLDVELEIAHLAYLEVKKGEDGKALLFTHPIDSKHNIKYDIPVLMNVFGSFKRLDLIIKKDPNLLAKNIESLLKPKKPKGIIEGIQKLKELWNLRHIFPKNSSQKPMWRDKSIQADKIDLFSLPILKTWEYDGSSEHNGRFITMGQVYSTSLDGHKKNLGMYRLQVYDKNHLGLHWQIHKDANHFFHEYKKAGVKMPVSIALGGDPLYIWCGQAPLPMGFFELMLYGFIKEERAKLGKCDNGIYVPLDCDIVIEGYVDTSLEREEGPFGDHTGYYTLIESYPVMEVSSIHIAKNATYPATVVGKPPLEDKYMGYLTERIFLPLLSTTAHGLLDYHMPENGVFHNLILAKISSQYPGHAKQTMHNFWGVGQMSFVKHAIFVGENAPKLEEYDAIIKYILNSFSLDCIVISEGVCDALDHSSPSFAYGGKLGLDLSVERAYIKRDLSDIDTLRKDACVVDVRRYFEDSNTPIVLFSVEKKENMLNLMKSWNLNRSLGVVFVALDSHNNALDNLYMILWRVVNNIDAKRDICIDKDVVLVDATAKNRVDGFEREWPRDVNATPSVIESLRQKGLLDDIDDSFLEKFRILN